MNGHEVEAMQARVRGAQRWLRVTLLGWVLTIAMLVAGWILSMTMLATSLRLFDAVASLP
jgi:hypothetical protein